MEGKADEWQWGPQRWPGTQSTGEKMKLDRGVHEVNQQASVQNTQA